MSSTIEYRHFALKLDVSKANEEFTKRYVKDGFYTSSRHDTAYLFFTEVGESNVTEMNYDTGREVLSRNQYLTGIGTKERLMNESFRYLGGLEDGSIKVGGRSKWCKPENYIALYRRELERALPIVEFEPTYGEFQEFGAAQFPLRSVQFRTPCEEELMKHPYSEEIKDEIKGCRILFNADDYVKKIAWLNWVIDCHGANGSISAIERMPKHWFDERYRISTSVARQARYQAKKQALLSCE